MSWRFWEPRRPTLGERLVAAAWVPFAVVGLAGALALALRRPAERSVAGGGRAQPSPRRGSPPTDLKLQMRQSLIGQTREGVRRAMGLPRTATVAGVPDGASPEAVCRAADVWYYAVAGPERSAVAVTFEGDRVREVEFLGGAVVE